MRVLVVDDEQLILLGIKKILEKTEAVHCEVQTASNAAAALEALEHFAADLLITDISMPRMNGLELVREVKHRDLCRQFLILSGFSEFEYAQQALRAGVADYLLKPVNPEELRQAVVEAAHRAGQQGELDYLRAYAPYFSHADSEAVPYPLQKLVAYIRSHYREAVSLAALSELSGWSEGYICSQFKKEWGIGYMDLVNELRLKESLYLLLYRDDLTVKEIAGQVGYLTERQLFRLFKKTLSMTPLQIRDRAHSGG